MTAAAQRAQLDFVRLSGEEPSSLYLERFLRDGFSSWPSAYRRRFPGLDSWCGVAGLKQSLKRLAGVPDHGNVLLSSRSLSLVQLAVRCLFRSCRKVLATDLSWPTYRRALESRAARTGHHIKTVPLREHILRRRWTADHLAEHLAHAFAEHHCDGLFLPAVDHLGIRVPVRQIVERIRRVAELRFCLIDAAQAFCHVPLDEAIASADFVVAGGHKWMGAYLPIGIGLFGSARSREMIQRQLRRLRERASSDDPLMNFTEHLDGGTLESYSETANLTPLFACAGASADRLSEVADAPPPIVDRTAIDSLPRPAGDWQPLRPDESLRTRIILLESQRASRQDEPADVTRRRWLDAGMVVSAYPGGMVRLSIAHGRRHGNGEQERGMVISSGAEWRRNSNR